MVHEEQPVISFTANDRCDRCGAQAYTLARKDTLELMFCAHHAGANQSAANIRQQLFDNGWEIIDDAAGYEDLGYEVPELV